MTRNEPIVKHILFGLGVVAVAVAVSGVVYRGLLDSSSVSMPVAVGAVASYGDICAHHWSMTETQFREHARRSVGKRVINWKGWVLESQSYGGWYNLEIALEPPGDLALARDMVLYGVPASAAEEIQWGEPITFSGTIRRVDILNGLCKPVIEDLTVLATMPVLGNG